MMGLVSLQKRHKSSSLCHVRTQQEHVMPARRVLLLGKESAGSLILNFQPPE